MLSAQLRNTTRSLSLMSARQVNSGTGISRGLFIIDSAIFIGSDDASKALGCYTPEKPTPWCNMSKTVPAPGSQASVSWLGVAAVELQQPLPGLNSHNGRIKTFPVLLTVVVSLTLSGCFGWDEGAERGVCLRAFPSDKAKADECYRLNKAMYDKDHPSAR
jgi:hypothetical protein